MSSFPVPDSAASFNDDQPYRLTPAVQMLLALNAAVMFVQVTVFNGNYPSLLAFDSSALPARWYTAFTYMFAHAGLWHLLANMYGLFLFGPRVERSLGTRKFTWFYLLCGLGGVVFQMLFIRGGTLIGASAAVFGVMTAYAMQWPDDEVYLMFVLPMRVRSLVAGLLVFNLVLGIAASGDAGATNIAYFAHVGGVIAAYVYMRMAASAGMENVRQRVANLPDVDEPPRAIPRNMPRRERGDEVDDIVAKSKAAVAKRTVSVRPSAPRRQPRADELDRVLDKISQQGLESLTADERKVLEEMSRRLRDS
jgi:membrane associated rhomboid family serine protease